MKRALAAVALSAFASAAAAQSGNNLEIIHHPNYDKNVFMPFSPAIKAVLELGEPEQLVEIQVVAVVDN